MGVACAILATMRKTLLMLALILLTSHAVAGVQYLRFGKLIDGKGKVWTNVMVVVENDRIRSVERDEPPSGADIIDLRRYTGIPGLIDAHTHMTYYWDQAAGTTPWSQTLEASVRHCLPCPGERP